MKEELVNREAVGNLQPAELVTLLQKSGSHTFSPERLQRDLAAGAPVNPDGTMDLVAYSAWLAHKKKR